MTDRGNGLDLPRDLKLTVLKRPKAIFRNRTAILKKVKSGPPQLNISVFGALY